MTPINLAFLRIAKRADQQEDDVLARTFVNFSSVLEVISSRDHQLIYGRRGTGKTHLLTVLRQSRSATNEVVIQLDMRNLGSAGGIYADTTVPVVQRATRLLLDVISAVHAGLLEQAVETETKLNLTALGPPLDELLAAHTEVRIVGDVKVTSHTSSEDSRTNEGKAGIKLSITDASLEAGRAVGAAAKQAVSTTREASGQEVAKVNFSSIGTALRKIVAQLPNQKLWILLDEWSETPLELQPYLADLLRRAMLPIKGVTVKIAAIEQRTKLLLGAKTSDRLGLEIGADIAASIDLDDYMVFENDEDKAVAFFKSLFTRHVQSALEVDFKANAPKDESELIAQGFTQLNAFNEVVRACEGVPRDAINILAKAAQTADDSTISIQQVRSAAQQWYLASKDQNVGAHQTAKALLTWIVEKVIKQRQTKAFLLQSNTRDELIDFLYDERVLHLLRKGLSAQDEPGKRYNVYAIDYGCYVDLINTARFPDALLDLGIERQDFTNVVPATDFRSVRRCVLDLESFYAATPQS